MTGAPRNPRSVVVLLLAWVTLAGNAAAQAPAQQEEIYILRSIREQAQATPGWCSAARAGFEPFPADADRSFSFWSVSSDSANGRVVDAMDTRVAELRACFGATSERVRQNFYAEITLGSVSFYGKGECVALAVDFPEPGLYPVHCNLVLGGLPPPYLGGVLTTNTLTSKAVFGGESDPPGYTQASIATIRLWKSR